MRRIVRESEGIGLRRPRFEFGDGHFKVTFFAPEEMLKLKSQSARPIFEIKEDILKDLSTTQRQIMKILLVENETTVPILSDRLNLALPTIRKALGVLKDRRLVVQRGKARETTYSLNLPQVDE